MKQIVYTPPLPGEDLGPTFNNMSPLQKQIAWSKIRHINPADYGKTNLAEVCELMFNYPYDIEYQLDKLTDIDKAAEIIKNAQEEQYDVVLVTDYDADGCSSMGTLYTAFNAYFKFPKVHCIVNRRIYGNGVNSTMVGEILTKKSERPMLIITADHGSVNNDSYMSLKEEMPDCLIIVTDHHLVDYNNYPTHADAFVNPQRTDCVFDKCISGCVTAMLVCIAAYRKIHGTSRDHRHIMAYGAFSTISDVMSLASPLNRYIVREGLNYINMNDPRDRWFYLKNILNIPGDMRERDISFTLAPYINTGNGLNVEELSAGVMCQLPSNPQFKETAMELLTANTRRKSEISRVAREIISTLRENKRQGPIVALIDTNINVAGAIAGRVGVTFNQPTIIFKNTGNTCHGSGRGIIKGFNIVETLKKIDAEHPGILQKFGGHAAACGLSVEPDRYSEFARLFEEYTTEALKTVSIDEALEVVTELPLSAINYDTESWVSAIGPFGKDWELPLFKSRVRIISVSESRGEGKLVVVDPEGLSEMTLFTTMEVVDECIRSYDIRSFPREAEIIYSMRRADYINRYDETIKKLNVDVAYITLLEG